MRPVVVFELFLGVVLVGCSAMPESINETISTAQGPFPTPTSSVARTASTPENASLADKDPQYLCDNLVDLGKMSWDSHDYSGDAVYDALKRKGHDAVPCLVEKITDTHPAKNPTGAPFWAGLTYRVGDTAVLMLMRINNMYWPTGMLAKKYENMYPSEGVFSYYFYVDEVPGARKDIQRWWRNWLKSCRPECAIVPSIEH
jgi:hypothetical protein